MAKEKETKRDNAQRRAEIRWAKRNPEKKRYSSMYSTAKSFARHYAKKRAEIEVLLDMYDKENKNSPTYEKKENTR